MKKVMLFLLAFLFATPASAQCYDELAVLERNLRPLSSAATHLLTGGIRCEGMQVVQALYGVEGCTSASRCHENNRIMVNALNGIIRQDGMAVSNFWGQVNNTSMDRQCMQTVMSVAGIGQYFNLLANSGLAIQRWCHNKGHDCIRTILHRC